MSKKLVRSCGEKIGLARTSGYRLGLWLCVVFSLILLEQCQAPLDTRDQVESFKSALTKTTLADLDVLVGGTKATLWRVPESLSDSLFSEFDTSKSRYAVAAQAGDTVTFQPHVIYAGQTVTYQTSADGGTVWTASGATISPLNDNTLVKFSVTSGDGKSALTYLVTVMATATVNTTTSTGGIYTASTSIPSGSAVRLLFNLAGATDKVALIGIPPGVFCFPTDSNGSLIALAGGITVPGTPSFYLTMFNISGAATGTFSLSAQDNAASTVVNNPVAQSFSYVHNVALATDGAYLYFSNGGELYRQPLQPLSGGDTAELLTSIPTGTPAAYIHGLAYLAGTLYISDHQRNAIYKYELSTGQLTLIAGLPGTAGDVPSGNETVAGIDARFHTPRELTTDGTWLYVPDDTNHKVRRINLTTYQVNTLADTPIPATANKLGPFGIAYKDGYVYVSDWDNFQILKVSTTDGTQQVWMSGLATPASGISVGGNSLFVPTSGTVSVYSLSGAIPVNPSNYTRTYPVTTNPYAVLADPHNPDVIYVTDPYDHTIRSYF